MKSTITTPFDMRVQNEIDRFNLVKTVVYSLLNLGNKAASLVQLMNDKLVEHKECISKYGEDMPKIKN